MPTFFNKNMKLNEIYSKFKKDLNESYSKFIENLQIVCYVYLEKFITFLEISRAKWVKFKYAAIKWFRYSKFFKTRSIPWPNYVIFTLCFLICLIIWQINFIKTKNWNPFICALWYLSILWNAIWVFEWIRVGAHTRSRRIREWQHSARVRYDRHERRVQVKHNRFDWYLSSGCQVHERLFIYKKDMGKKIKKRFTKKKRLLKPREFPKRFYYSRRFFRLKGKAHCDRYRKAGRYNIIVDYDWHVSWYEDAYIAHELKYGKLDLDYLKAYKYFWVPLYYKPVYNPKWTPPLQFFSPLFPLGVFKNRFLPKHYNLMKTSWPQNKEDLKPLLKRDIKNYILATKIWIHERFIPFLKNVIPAFIKWIRYIFIPYIKKNKSIIFDYIKTGLFFILLFTAIWW